MFNDLLSDTDKALLLVSSFTKRMQHWMERNRGRIIPPDTVKAIVKEELVRHLYELYQRGILHATSTDARSAAEGLTVEVQHGVVTIFLQGVLSKLRLPAEKPTGCKLNLNDLEKPDAAPSKTERGRFVDLEDETK